MSIGGADATVVRNPLTNEPYIPGSSLKGKMRSLLERAYGQFGDKQDNSVVHSPFTDVDKDIAAGIKRTFIPTLFGTTPEMIAKSKEIAQPTSRLIVRLAFI